jgi:nitronate monooxygenase
LASAAGHRPVAGCEHEPVALTTRFTQLLGCRHPLQQAGMGGLATPELAGAVASAGGLGMLSSVVRAASVSEHLEQVAGVGVVGVNFLLPFLDEAVLEESAGRARFVEFFWGAPTGRLVETGHAGGALVGWQVGSVDEATAAADVGCDVIVVQGVEAGGHVRGTTGLLPLLDGVRAAVDVPIVAAGGIGSGRAMAAALAAGADAVRVGTRFLAALESTAHPDYVDALIDAGPEDTVLTTAFGDGWPDAPHRVLRSAVQAAEALGTEHAGDVDGAGKPFAIPRFAIRPPNRATRGPIAAMALYAGQSVDAVTAITPAADVVREITTDAEQFLRLATTRL